MTTAKITYCRHLRNKLDEDMRIRGDDDVKSYMVNIGLSLAQEHESQDRRKNRW